VFIQVLLGKFVIIMCFNTADRFKMCLPVEFDKIPIAAFPEVYAQVGEYNGGFINVNECCFDFIS